MATIGELEQQAGIGSSDAERTAFWLRFHHIDGKACLDAGVAELKRMIAERDGTALRAARHRRPRWPALADDQEAALPVNMPSDMVGVGRASLAMSGWGAPPRDDGGILWGLRNTHGPTWLQSYRLPKAVIGSGPDGSAAVSSEHTGRVKE